MSKRLKLLLLLCCCWMSKVTWMWRRLHCVLLDVLLQAVSLEVYFKWMLSSLICEYHGPQPNNRSLWRLTILFVIGAFQNCKSEINSFLTKISSLISHEVLSVCLFLFCKDSLKKKSWKLRHKVPLAMVTVVAQLLPTSWCREVKYSKHFTVKDSEAYLSQLVTCLHYLCLRKIDEVHFCPVVSGGLFESLLYYQHRKIIKQCKKLNSNQEWESYS